jgi:predicted GNAT superfamily acetyltransferase
MKFQPIILATIGAGILMLAASAALPAKQRSTEEDKQALLALENDWLASEHDPATLNRIIASDFVHPVVSGDFLTKAEHIDYSSKHLPAANLKQHFEQMKVRIYGDVGIVNGIVATENETGGEVARSIFTDVFVYRKGQWLAVNAQENKVEN